MSDKPSIGVDLGGTKILTALVSPEGDMIAGKRSPTAARSGPEEVIARIFTTIEQVLHQANAEIGDIRGIGIAAAGALDTERGVVTTSPNLPGWRDVPLRGMVRDRFGAAAFLINDANAAALGEHRFGAGKSVDNLIYITVSTGIGGGIIIDGKLYQGAGGSAGEVGHMTIDINGPRCSCGSNGCLEVLASGTALAREAQRCITEGAESSILRLADGKISSITAKIVSDAAQDGDLLARELIHRTGTYLGIGLANLVNIFNPEMIIVGGGLSNIGDMLLNPARQMVMERAFKVAAQRVRIVPSQLGGNAEAVGAAAFVPD